MSVKSTPKRLAQVSLKTVTWRLFVDGSEGVRWNSKDEKSAWKVWNRFAQKKTAKATLKTGKSSAVALHVSDAGFSDIWQTQEGLALLSFYPGDDVKAKDRAHLPDRVLTVPAWSKPRKAGEIEIISGCLAIVDPSLISKHSQSKVSSVSKGRKAMSSRECVLVPMANGKYEIYVEMLGASRSKAFEDNLGEYDQRIRIVPKGSFKALPKGAKSDSQKKLSVAPPKRSFDYRRTKGDVQFYLTADPDKFWFGKVVGTKILIEQGKVGAEGKTSEANFSSPAAAKEGLETLYSKLFRKGFFKC